MVGAEDLNLRPLVSSRLLGIFLINRYDDVVCLERNIGLSARF